MPGAWYTPAPGSGAGGGERGPEGEKGLSVLNGSGAPAPALGRVGEYYIDNVAHELYGPKAEGTWGAGTKLIGPQGPEGPKGTTGAEGPKGTTGEKGEKGEKGEAGGAGVLAYVGVESPNAKLELVEVKVATGTDGTTHMTSTIKAKESCIAGTLLFTLPLAHRPAVVKNFQVQRGLATTGATAIEVKTNGEVKVWGSAITAGEIVSFDPVVFSHEH